MPDFDNDPEALEWARGKIQREIDRMDSFMAQARARGDREQESRWRGHRNLLSMKFIGGEGCSIAAFDERLPAFNEAFRKADKR